MQQQSKCIHSMLRDGGYDRLHRVHKSIVKKGEDHSAPTAVSTLHLPDGHKSMRKNQSPFCGLLVAFYILFIIAFFCCCCFLFLLLLFLLSFVVVVAFSSFFCCCCCFLLFFLLLLLLLSLSFFCWRRR